MNFQDNIRKQQLLNILSLLIDKNAMNYKAKQSELVLHFQQLGESDKVQFIQYINEQYSNQPLQKQEISALLLKPQEELQSTYFENLDQAKNQQVLQQIQSFNQSSQNDNAVESESDVLSEKLYIKLEYILEDIKDGLLANETEIMGEITPIFNQLNKRHQEKCKTILHNEFKEFSFVQNNLFTNEIITIKDSKCSQSNREIFQSLKIQRDWKKLLSYFQEDQFIQENQIPQYWKTKECVRILSAHEFVFENILNLKELNESQLYYNYIDTIQILLMVLCYSKNHQNDRTIIEQIVGSTLNLQMLQFVEYQTNLQIIDKNMFQKMAEDFNYINQNKLIQLTFQFMIFDFNHSLKSQLMNIHSQKLNLIQNVACNPNQFLQITNLIMRRENLEELYFMLTFYFQIQYCQIFNFQKERILIDENLQKLKGNKDRQCNYLIRSLKKKIAESDGDQILDFLANCLLYFQENLFDLNWLKSKFTQFQFTQEICNSQLKKLQNMSFEMLLDNPEFQKILIDYCGQASIIKVSHFFPSQQDMGLRFPIVYQIFKYESKIANDILYYACRQQKKSLLQCLQFIETFCEKFKNSELTVYCFILARYIDNLSDESLIDLIGLFRIENTLDKFGQICYLKSMNSSQFLNNIGSLSEIVQKFFKFTTKDWLTIKYSLGYSQLEFFYDFLVKNYFKLQTKTELENDIYLILLQLLPLIQKSSGQNIWSSKQLFIILPKKTLNFLISNLQEINVNSEKVLKQMFCIIVYILQKLGDCSKLQMIDFFYLISKNSNIQFELLQEHLKKKISFNLQYQYLLICYYYQNNNEELLLKKAREFFFQNQESYISFFFNLNYFNHFKLNPQYLKIQFIQQQYPLDAQINLEDFNISLQEISQKEKQQIVNEWLENMSNTQKFRQLIPIYFNLIKRKEQSKNFLSLINNLNGNNNQGLNMKALFQILYNNSNNELKSMLLKLWSSTNPVPFIFSNPNINNVKAEQDLYCLNEKLNFIFPDCLPIISFSLSKKSNAYGKTFLINQTFYQAEVFEQCDNYPLNENTIDIMFDFCFSGRQFAVADVHGIIPFGVLLKILPLFQVWIIQMDSEKEFEENYQQLLEIQKLINIPECCLVIRNSNLKQDETQQIQVNIQNVSIHSVIDITKKGLDKQAINFAKEQFSRFIFDKLERRITSFKIFNSQQFQNILSEFYGKNHPDIIQISQNNKILEQLSNELKSLILKPEGFFSQNAFPIRSLHWQIKQIEQEKIQFSDLNKEEYQKKIEDKNNRIKDLEKLFGEQKSTRLLNLFQKLFAQNDDFYTVYIKFADQIRKFNEEHTSKLQYKMQDINVKIQKQKLEKKKRKLQNSSFLEKQNDCEYLKQLKRQLEQNQIQILIQIRKRGQSSSLLINPVEIIASMIKKGENFEFLDGDSLQIDQQLLKEILKSVADSDNEKVLVLSVLGPQSSGKSTILNKIFGCHFWTSVGRCTKGIYLQLLKIPQKQLFEGLFDYILILDTEGLQNPNQNDHEFDKKIALFILSISDIILINVKGDIHSQFKSLVEMCIYTLGLMKNEGQSAKQLSWCFNQNNDCKNFTPFFEQIQSIVTNLNMEANQQVEDQQFDYHELLDIKKENIKILGFAFTEQTWRISSTQQSLKDWRQQIVNESFAEEAYIFGIQMITQFVKNIKIDRNHKQQSLSQFIQNIESNWQMICKFPDLLEFTELLQYKQDQSMKTFFEEIYSSHHKQLDYQNLIPQLIEDQVQIQKFKSLAFFEQLQNDQRAYIQSERSKIKVKVEESLFQFKQENKIQNKIYKKYIRFLDESLQNFECNCQVTLFEAVTKHEREFQQKKGFSQLDEWAAKIDPQKLTEIRFSNQLIQQEFSVIWNNILKQQKEQQEKIFEDFSLTQFQAIQSSFFNYQYKSSNQENYKKYFFELSKTSPDILKKQQEQEEILQYYLKEICSNRQFQIIQKSQQNLKYTDIFNQPLSDRIEKCQDDFLVNLKNFYEFSSIFYFVSKTEFYKYLTEQKIQEDLVSFLKKEKLSGNTQQKESIGNKLFSNFFSILSICNINFIKEKYEIMKDFIVKDSSRWYYFGIDTQNIFSQFQQNLSFSIEKGSNIIMNSEFTQNLRVYYPSLRLQDKQLAVENINELQSIIENENKNYIYFFSKQCYFPKKNSQKQILEFISDQLQHCNLQYYQNNIVSWFESTMILNKGWEKIYFQIYDIIKCKMTKVNDISIKNGSENEETLLADSYLIKQIISSIQLKIFEYNKQFANFGIIFNLIGERCIYYYSTFIIWRFSCYSKWKSLEESNKKLLQMNHQQLERFTAGIQQNMAAQSFINAEVLGKNIKQEFLDKFYLVEKQYVCSQIESISISCSKLVSILDKQLLQNYQKAKQNNIEDEDIIEYIMDQKSYIEKYVEKLIKQKEEIIKKQLEGKLQSQLEDFLISINNNISKIYNFTNKYMMALKSEDVFDSQSFDITKGNPDRILYKLISQCIFGKTIQKKDLSIVNNDLKEIFEQKFKLISFEAFTKSENDPEMRIPQLQPFIDTIYLFFKQEIQNCKDEHLIWKNFNAQGTLNKLKHLMIGCQFSCPMCKRKCDQPDDQNHKHFCSNGHQYRGMNGVLINNQPSLFFCEEIDDNVLVTTLETSVQRKWKTIKNAYPEWNFSGATNKELLQLKEKMKDIWNSGTGNLVCIQLTKIFKKEIKFLETNTFDQQNIHYIFMLDDSGSMKGENWIMAKNETLQCMKSISKNFGAKISVIIFNNNARVVIDCQYVDIKTQQELICQKGGGTDFSEAFLMAYNQIIKHAKSNFEKNIILFYTDGQDTYPNKLKQFNELPQNLKQTIKLVSCAQGKDNETLNLITKQLRVYGMEAELKSNISLQNLSKVWTEVVSQTYHPLKC